MPSETPTSSTAARGRGQHGALQTGDDRSREQDVSAGILLGLASPLLDISVHISNDFLARYSLEADNQIRAQDEHLPLFREISEMPGVEIVPGGATQNSIKFAQWLLQTPERTVLMGCIGNDRFGEILQEKAASVGVSVHYQRTDAQPTGTVACLVSGKSRSLIANPAAANCFTVSHLMEPQNWRLVERAQYYYIAAFFLTVCPPALMAVAEHALARNKTFVTNLAAPFISQRFLEPLMAAMPYVDILFGNEHEAAAFGKAMNLGDDIGSIALKTASLPKLRTDRPRIVIFTQGAKPTVVVEGDRATEYPVAPVADDEIVDTNGAGDAFVGGFLAQLVRQRPLSECMRCANYAANVAIKRSGCTFPPGAPSYE